MTDKPKQAPEEQVNAKKTADNGYILYDPKIEVGDRAILDEDYANCSYVIVMELGQIFARVRSEGMEWVTRRNRLTSTGE